MKIVENRKSNIKPFGDLRIGEIFIDCEDTEDYCIRIEPICDAEELRIYNAFSFSKNVAYFFDDEEKVEPCKGYLVIE